MKRELYFRFYKNLCETCKYSFDNCSKVCGECKNLGTKECHCDELPEEGEETCKYYEKMETEECSEKN